MRRDFKKWAALAICTAMLGTSSLSVNAQEIIEYEKTEETSVTEQEIAEEIVEEIVEVPEAEVMMESPLRGGHSVGNPVATKDDTMASGQIVEYDCVYFGKYLQEDTNKDGVVNSEDEKRPIKWRVLSVEGDEALLLSDKILDMHTYCDKRMDTSWENSDVRRWLNNEFATAAFNSQEQSAIKVSTVKNEGNSKFGSGAGADTYDKVFLLSEGETRNPDYGFTAKSEVLDEARRARFTDYSESKGILKYIIYDNDIYGAWWLRTTGNAEYDAVIVHGAGTQLLQGAWVNDKEYGIRPAIRIDLTSSGWEKADKVKAAKKYIYKDNVTLGQATAKVTFDLMGGSMESDILSYKKNKQGNAVSAKLNIPSRVGKTFKGWVYEYTDKNGQKKEKKVTKLSEKFLKEHSEITLSAKWEYNQYTLIYKVKAPCKVETATYMPKKWKIYYYETVEIPQEYKVVEKGTGKEYVVDKWIDDEGRAYVPGTKLEHLYGKTKKEKKLVLTAHWASK